MLQLFYQAQTDRNERVESFLRSAGRTFEHFYIDEHRDEYDHGNNDPTWNGCFCNWPDTNDAKWPKLFDNCQFVVSGEAEILAFNLNSIPDTPLVHLQNKG
jgi:hypothetical protein